MKKFVIALCAASLSGCMNLAEVTTPPQPVAYTSAGVQAATIGVTPSTVRSFAAGEEENSRGPELVGAACDLRGTGFGAEFITPAIIQTPKFKGGADPITVTCRANGQIGTYNSRARNLTLERISNAGRGQTSLLGVEVASVATGVAAAARNPLNDEFGYASTIGVTMPGTVQ